MNKIIGIIGTVLFFYASSVQSTELNVGCIKTVQGSAIIVRSNQSVLAKIGERIYKNDSLKTGPDGSLGMIFKDDTLLSIGPNSEIVVKEFLFSPGEGKLSWVTRLVKGTAACLTGIIAKLSPQSVRFETPVAQVGIRGTRFAVQVQENKEGEHENR